MGRVAFLVIVITACLSSCGKRRITVDQTPPPEVGKNTIMVEGIPHIHQKPDFCGEACTAMVLKKLGFDKATQDDVFNQSTVPPATGRGCHSRELKLALEALGFDIGNPWNKVSAEKATQELSLLFMDVIGDLRRKVPSIVCMHYDDSANTTEHFRLIIGFDPKTDMVVYHEPAKSDGAAKRMSRTTFLKLWPLKYKKNEWLAIRFPLNPKKIQLPRRAVAKGPEGKPRPVFTNADYAQHVMALRKKYPVCRNMTTLIEPPFVVLGNESEALVKRRAAGTVRWSVEKLKKGFFSSDPNRILTIWLLKDRASYRDVSRRVTGSVSSSPYGYFSSSTDSLIMNIATGGGTLVHEIVHPFVEANFPDAPSWLNEGLGSLFEACKNVDGKIIGMTNWRLKNLKKEIADKSLPSFKTLTGYSDSTFYAGPIGDNYAQSRYLCYYLQEKKLLRKFYHAFLKARKIDPTGYETLKATLKVDDMDAFKKEWETYVLKLQLR